MVSDAYYIGSDLKFQLDIDAPGFDQNRDDYTVDLYCGSSHLVFTQDDVISHDGKFYLPISTEELEPGMMRFVITAFVPDSDFNEGIRKEISVINLKYLKTVM